MLLINKGKKLHHREHDHTIIVIMLAGLGLACAASSSIPMSLRCVFGWLTCSLVSYVVATRNEWPFNWLDDAGDWRAIALGPLTLAACLLRQVFSVLLLPFPGFKAGTKLSLDRLNELYGREIVIWIMAVMLFVLVGSVSQGTLSIPAAIALAVSLIVVGRLLYRQSEAYAKHIREERKKLYQ